MKIVLQRVKHCSVTVSGSVCGAIEQGFLILLGVEPNDTPEHADFLAKKCAHLRIFHDTENKMNLSIIDIQGQALVVSQFTLLGDCSRGRRPDFTNAAEPKKAKELYDYFVVQLKKLIPHVETGVFGAMMDVALVNDGPITLLLDR
jgi:D-tyrosyl-tRNA(Tyr) deacylase